MRRLTKPILLILIIIASQKYAQLQTITPLYPTDNKISLDGSWKFKYIPSAAIGNDSIFYTDGFDVSRWSDINVPGHWELQGFAEPKYKSVDEGTGLYRTEFSIPASMKGNQIFIRFEGVLYAYEVYVNGEKAGDWSSSYNAASFNISKFLHFDQKNTLAVKVSTRPKGYQFDINDDWALSGIFRSVILFGAPNVYIDDYTVQTTLPTPHTASVKLKVELAYPKKDLGSYSLKTVLKSPKGETIQTKTENAKQAGNRIEMTIDEPELWTAETPSLYTLEISLLSKDKELQKLVQQVGIREISIDGTVLKLNGKPIKLRGVDYHDLCPQTGKTLSQEQILNDLLLMKKANINFLRTSHYPPDRRRLDLCDSLGIYVVCEVPFGFGNSFLQDSSYQGNLLTRARATLLRDKNHPSVILWSLGNENPVTPITNVTAQYVKITDPTRPICYPQMGSYFNENYRIIPDYMDIYAPHYRDAEWVKSFAKETDRPVIQTEYAHALGLAFGNMAEIWQEMFRNEAFAGGAVWLFQDQGILRTADKPVNTKELTYDVWIDSVHYYNTTLDGADGIVYPDRTPQPDYWQLRKIYSPVQIIESEIPAIEGKQKVSFTVYNQYDFSNLNTLNGNWILYQNQNIFQKGEIEINCEPHDTITYSLPVELPENSENSIWILKFEFSNNNGESIYEHSINLPVNNNIEIIKASILANPKNQKLISKNKGNATIIEASDFIYQVEKDKLQIDLQTEKDGINLLNSVVCARTGRNPNMADVTVHDKYFAETGDYFWDPWTLKPEYIDATIKTEKGKYNISATETFLRGKNFPGQKLKGDFQYTITKAGELQIAYELTPERVSGFFLEAGISLVLPKVINNFYWLGDGPYASYPDKKNLNDFGIHKMHKNDIHFNGNRANVEIAILTDDEGNGLAVLSDSKNISVELNNGQIVVSQNVFLSGLGNKKNIPSQIIRAEDVFQLKGVLKIIPLQKSSWPETLRKIFCEQGIQLPKPFKPFYYSYDTSK